MQIEKLNDLIVRGKDKEFKKIYEQDYKKSEILNKKYLENITLLSQAIQKANYKLVKYLLENGANSNGITKEGNTDIIPAGFVFVDFNRKTDDQIELIDLLLEYGLDINYYGNSLKTILGYAIEHVIYNAKRFKTLKIDVIKYLLEKGANPNIKICQALFEVVNNINKYMYFDKDIIKLFDILIYYNANPYLVDVNGYTLSNYLKSTQIPLDFQKEISSHVFINLEDVLKDCKDILQIKKMANAFKIPFKESDLKKEKELKKICECISLIKENFHILSEDDFQNIIDLRSEKNKLICDNIYTIDMVDLNEFFKEGFYTLETGINTKSCFVKNELLYLIQNKKNPWTGQPLSIEQIKDIIKNLKVEPFTDTALSDAIDIFNKKMIEDFTLNDLLEVYSHLLTPYNPYPTYTDISKINLGILWFLASDILSANLGGILNFNMVNNLKLISEDYTRIKLYELLLKTLKYITYQNSQPGNIDSVKLSYFLERALLLNNIRNKIMSLILDKYNIDLTIDENDNIFRKTFLQNLGVKTFLNLDGNPIEVGNELAEDILQTILETGENLFKLDVFNRDDAINLWNNKIGYTLRFF